MGRGFKRIVKRDLLLRLGRFRGGLLAFVIGDAALLFDDLVGLLSHKSRGGKGRNCANRPRVVKREDREQFPVGRK